jgi:hypothetical protein
MTNSAASNLELVMLNRPEPNTSFDVRREEIRDGIEDQRERDVFDRAISHLDREAYAAVYEKYKANIKGPGLSGWEKYLDVCFWLRDKISRAVGMGLMDAKPSRLLDLGTGAGHWLAICGAMGHDAVGLDVEFPMCVELCHALGVDRRTYRIRPREALPDLGRFDFVTAFALKFDGLGRDQRGDYLYWSLADWDFFLRDVTGNRMRYPGVLHLELNSRILPTGETAKFTDVMDACRNAGADVSKIGSRIQFDVNGPVGLALPAEARSKAGRARAAVAG